MWEATEGEAKEQTEASKAIVKKSYVKNKKKKKN